MSKLERELKRGTLELLLLRILADEPTYGYELLSRLAARTGGGFGLKEGTLYPVLYRLEDAGLVEPKWEQPDRSSGRGVPRKVYKLTEAGEGRVSELTDAWRSFSAAVEAVLAGISSPSTAPEGGES
ncbi:MAG: PadR family transcriptional regulator [Thermoanaerobaculia bacterium]